MRGPVLFRAEVTRVIGPGTKYLVTREYHADGTIREQVNPGLPDLEGEWREVGREPDLAGAPDRLRAAGWLLRD
jgi:hypothetical protein